MPFTIDGEVKRNIQEQVYENKKNIEAWQGTNKVGIKVVGRVDTIADLPSASTYQGSYGDTYAVGTSEPYYYYVFTRPAEGETYPYWFNIGQLGIQGPQGPTGPQGATGATGTRGSLWSVGTTNPSVSSSNKDGDMYLRADTGEVFAFSGNAWVRKSSIMGAQGPQGATGATGTTGPQGPQGIQGPTGDPGNFVHIAAILSSTSLLPDPATLQDTSIAYLVGDDKALYIQVGQSPETATWNNLGTLNVATYVTLGGSFVSSFDADTKLDKDTSEAPSKRIYAISSNGTQGTLFISSDAAPSYAMQRDINSRVKAESPSLGPTQSITTTNDKYVANLGNLPKYHMTTSPTTSFSVYSNLIEYVYVSDGSTLSMTLNVNTNGDMCPIWTLQLDYEDQTTRGWDDISPITNPILWLGGVKPTFEIGKQYTIMFWPSGLSSMNVNAGQQYQGILIGCWESAN